MTTLDRIGYLTAAALLIIGLAQLGIGMFIGGGSTLALAAVLTVNVYLSADNRRMRAQVRATNEQLRLARMSGGHL